MIPDPCVRVLFPQSLKRRTKNTFFSKFQRQCVSQNWGPEKKITLKYRDRKRKCIPKVGTGKEFYSQKMGPEEILPVPTFENQFLFRSPLLGYIFFSGPTFGIHFLFRSPYLGTNFFPVPISEIHFSFQVPLNWYWYSVIFQWLPGGSLIS